jgi:hypothetical protein
VNYYLKNTQDESITKEDANVVQANAIGEFASQQNSQDFSNIWNIQFG